MSKITLKLQDLNTGANTVKEFDSEEDTLAYLRERPRFTDVLGVVFEGLTPEQNTRLKAAMKPLDADEKAAEKALAEKAEKVAEAARALRDKEAEAMRERHREGLKNADPNRLMEVRYRYNTGLAGLELTDPDDGRPISDEVREAVGAWVAERNEWVEGRGQVVGE